MNRAAGVLAGFAAAGYAGMNAIFTGELLHFQLVSKLISVDGGHRAVKFSRWSGVQPEIYTEGLHLMVPWLEWPLIYDIRAKPNQIKSETGTKDLQMVNIGLRVLYRPDPNQIPFLAKNIGGGKFLLLLIILIRTFRLCRESFAIFDPRNFEVGYCSIQRHFTFDSA